MAACLPWDSMGLELALIAQRPKMYLIINLMIMQAWQRVGSAGRHSAVRGSAAGLGVARLPLRPVRLGTGQGWRSNMKERPCQLSCRFWSAPDQAHA